jgi:hypothetical protein
MDAFLIEKFEKQGGKPSNDYDSPGVEFQRLDILIQAVAKVAFDLGEANISALELGATEASLNELEKAEQDVCKLTASRLPGFPWVLS